ncbi:MAG: hypothetical protein ACJ718_07350, partial [Nitrososphaeraceae archaeon]
NNPLCRVAPIDNFKSLPPYDKEKYKEIILDAAETVLGFFGFDRAAYSNLKRNNRRKRWYEELREHRVRDIKTEMLNAMRKGVSFMHIILSQFWT